MGKGGKRVLVEGEWGWVVGGPVMAEWAQERHGREALGGRRGRN